ncbi:Ku protein [Kitasatospora sp. NPDC057692]|uniref:Ku protein n=1 Tax=Kitasatospora sp. NPDC057692 TaxID=3346215 RepID=UPI00367F5646
MAAKAIAKLTITFSLVSIPVSVYSATGQHTVPLHLVHAADGGRIRQRRVCEHEGQDVPPDQVVRGYQAPDGRTVVLTAYDRPYYLGPTTPAAAHPYAPLRHALLDAGQVAVVRTALRTRETPAVLRVREDTLVLHTLLWPDEIRSPAGIAPAGVELGERELALARTLMDAISEDLHLESAHDYANALEDVVEAKLRGIPAPHPAGALPSAPGTPIDLMAALERALADAEQHHPKTTRAVKNTSVKKTPTRSGTTGKALPPVPAKADSASARRRRKPADGYPASS